MQSNRVAGITSYALNELVDDAVRSAQQCRCDPTKAAQYGVARRA